MKSFYILILLLLFSCVENKKGEHNAQVKPEDAINISSEEPKNGIPKDDSIETKRTISEVEVEDLSGEYELVEGKLYDLDLKEDVYYKSVIVFEKLSETDYGYFYADKIKDLRPIGYYGIMRRLDNKFYKIGICDDDDIDENQKESFTKGIFINDEVKIILSNDVLGMITYGSNFKKYMQYKKKRPEDKHHLSLIKELNSVQKAYHKFVNNYKEAENYDKNKLEIEYINNSDNWKTIHRHKEDNVNIISTHNSYKGPDQLTKFSNLDTSFMQQFKNSDFVAEINSNQIKKLPLIDDTSFDTFIEGYYGDKVNVKLLRLEELYPNFYNKGYNYLPIDSYRLELSEDFYTIVVTIKKGDHEMETILINYDLGGNIIDHQVIAYDEIAEGMFRTQSKITKNKLVVHQIVWEQEPQIKQVTYQILEDGIIDGIDSRVLNDNISSIPIIFLALEKLQLNLLNTKTELIVSKEHPDNPDDIIVVIPEIVEEEEDHYYEYNSHILIINGRSGEVMQKFYESVKTNGWTSDAIMLKDIKIDTAPYLVSENKRAFGIRVYYYGSSHANPYENETLSLFVKSEDDTLVQVLKRYNVMDYGGEFYGECNGEFVRIKSVLVPSKNKTNNYFDMLINKKTTETKNFINDNGDCDAIDKTSMESSVLKFNGLEYIE